MKRTRIRSISLKRRAGRPEWAAVYREVDQRAGRLCEVWLNGVRCRQLGTERHHCCKPRSHNHEPQLIIKICTAHHRQVDAPYIKGRLAITPLGFGAFHCCVTTAADKFSARVLEMRRG